MSYVRAIAIAILLSALLVTPSACADTRPLVLLFETARGDGADKDLALSTTRALRNYFRETQRVEAAIFDRESPTVLRAIMEKKLTPDKVASYSSQTERLTVAKELSFQYAAGAEVAVKDVTVSAVGGTLLKSVPDTQSEPSPKPDPKAKPGKKTKGNYVPPPIDESRNRVITQVEVKLWLAQVDGGKNTKWEATGSSAIGGTTARDLDNAMQSAASAAVLNIARAGLAALPRISETPPTNGLESTAIGSDEPPKIAQPSSIEYAAKGDESLREGDIAVAIDQYSKAVNADPGNNSLRIKLAEAYARKGMFTEADDVLDRASENGASRDAIAVAKDSIENMKGPKPVVVKPPDPVKPENRVSLTSKPAASASTPAIAKIVEGDKFWNQGKPDEAADAYKESIKLDPSDWRAQERLALVNASMSLFGESRKVFSELNRVQPNPPANVVYSRYTLLLSYFDSYFKILLNQYDTAKADYEKHIITRESYYNVVKGLALRLESMAAFLDAMTVPATKQPSHLRRGIACGLMAQAASSLLDHLESNSAKSKSSAVTFATQAKLEFAAAQKLDENKIVIEQKPTPQPAPEPAPETIPEPHYDDNYMPAE